MYIEPIPIEIEDNKVFAQIAYLLDGTSIINEILEIRESFKIQKPFDADNRNAWKTHLLKLAGYDLNEYKDMKKIHAGDPNLDNKEWEKLKRWSVENEQHQLQFVQLQKQFWEKIAHVRRLYHYPPLYDDVIIQAVLFNKVSHFKSAYARLTHGNETDLLIGDENDIVHKIILTPYATREDVLAAFDEIKGEETKKESQLTDPPFSPKLEADTRNKIRDFRKWYWMNYKNNPDKVGYRKLAKLTGMNMETVRSGIRSYSDFISFKA